MKRRLEPSELVRITWNRASYCIKYIAGFYSLFSVTEEPFVTSGGMYFRYLFLQNV